MRNADFRFFAQIRSHFLLHQKTNRHEFLWGYPYLSPALRWHTDGDISRDIPTFLLPLNRHTNDDIPWDIPTFLLPFNWHTNYDTHWDIPTFSSPTFRDTFRYFQPVRHLLATTKRVLWHRF